MAYEKQNFTDGDILYASQLNHIEQGIVDNENAIGKKQDQGNCVTKTEASETYQEKLISGSSIKTINGVSLLGGRNIEISGSVLFSNIAFTAMPKYGCRSKSKQGGE